MEFDGSGYRLTPAEVDFSIERVWSMGDKEWYSNKELFEMFQNLSDELMGMSEDLKETRKVIQKYNGIREDIADNSKRITRIEEQERGKHELAEAIRRWGGWIIAIASFIYAVYS